MPDDIYGNPIDPRYFDKKKVLFDHESGHCIPVDTSTRGGEIFADRLRETGQLRMRRSPY